MQNIPTKTDGATTLPAVEFNQIPDELENAITQTGQALTSSDLSQLSKAMSVYAAGGDYYTDTGAADAYVLSVIGSKQAPIAYFTGMRVRFIVNVTSTGASTANVASLGVETILQADGATPLVAAALVAGIEVTLSYDGTNFRLVATASEATATPDDNVVTVTSTTNATTLDLDAADPFNAVFNHVFTEDTTFTFANPKATAFNSGFKIFLTNAAGAYTPTWPVSVIWGGGSEPDLTTANEKNVLVFETIDGGTIWYGALSIGAAA